MTRANRIEISNWAGSYRYHAVELVRPRSLAELQAIASRARQARVVATRHAFNGIGDAETLIGLDQLPGTDTIEIDAAAMTVRVGPDVTYARLARALNARRLALPNLASLSQTSVVGAIATASHGSGDRLGNLATSVRAMTIVTSAGDLVEIAGAELAGAAVHLGALGAVISVTLDVVPYYELRQDVYLDMDWEVLLAHFDGVFATGRSVSAFHGLGDSVRSVWICSDPGGQPPSTLFGARPARRAVHPAPADDPSSCTQQLGVVGPWSGRLPHFRADRVPSHGEEIQSELFVPRDEARAALRSLLGVAESLAPLLVAGEIRTVAGDGLWLSPQHGRDSVALGFTWRREPAAVRAAVATIESALADATTRVHWAKQFAATPERLAAAYPRMDDFAALRARLDPRGAFVNRWLARHLPGVAG